MLCDIHVLHPYRSNHVTYLFNPNQDFVPQPNQGVLSYTNQVAFFFQYNGHMFTIMHACTIETKTALDGT